MKVRGFKTHKNAETDADCQDAFGINLEMRSMAVADGMSQSIFQTIWAQMLVDKFVGSSDCIMNLETVRELSDEWRLKVDESVRQQEEAGKATWMVKNMLARKRSAGATFLGVRLSEDCRNYSYQVLGDSCLVQVGTDFAIEGILSSQGGEAFDNYPDYYDSDTSKPGKGKFLEGGGSLPSKGLMLVSDPFSDFLLRKKQEGNEKKFVGQMFSVRCKKDFEKLVSAFREQGMHDDDSTMVVVENDGCDGLFLDEVPSEGVNQPSKVVSIADDEEDDWGCILKRVKGLFKRANVEGRINMAKSLLEMFGLRCESFKKTLNKIVKFIKRNC